jgi:hypothetical protein
MPPTQRLAKRARLLSLTRQSLLLLAVTAVVWTIAVTASGGFVTHLGSLRISSKDPIRPLLLGILALTGAALLSTPGQRRQALNADWQQLGVMAGRVTGGPGTHRQRLLAALAAALLGLAVASVGITRGAFVVGGSDSYGYVSQAHLWATGTLRVDPIDRGAMQNPPGDIPVEALVPLGYRLAGDGRSLAPIYAPGLSIVMGLFERLGGRDAVFYVMPLLAGVMVWMTYFLGAALAGTAEGLLAAAFLSVSPAFVFQLTHAPMSDIPAAAWWAIALVLSSRRSMTSALVAGLAAGAAVATRPNLAPLAVVTCIVPLWDLTTSHPARVAAMKRLALFAAGPLGAVILVAIVNDYWYGSAVESGYGPLAGTFFQWQHLWPNLTGYTTWLVETQTPLVLLAAVAPVLLWRTHRDGRAPLGLDRRWAMLIACTAFALAVGLCYVFYLPFGAWWFLRLLLPAFPIGLVFMSAAIVRLARAVPQVSGVLIVAIAAFLVSNAIGFDRENYVADSSGERRFADVGHYVNQHLPARAALFSMLHSGSVRYYSGRLSVRYDFLSSSQLAAAIAGLQQAGYATFLLIDESEDADFRARFPDTIGTAAAPELAAVSGVKVYSALWPAGS